MAAKVTEAQTLHDIRLRLGREPDLALFRNQVGTVCVDGRWIKHGIGVGSPDLIGILAPHGRWFCLEIKSPTGRVSAEQSQWHMMARGKGAHVAVVRSVDEALEELEKCRRA